MVCNMNEKKKKIIALLVSTLTVVGSVASLLFTIYDLFSAEGFLPTKIPLSMIVSLCLAVLLSIILTYFSAQKDREETNRYYDVIRETVMSSSNTTHDNKNVNAKSETEDARQDTTDILKLMLANMREIKDYYVLSKSQARNAFAMAVAMCILGFVFMCVSVAAAFLNSSNLVASIIPAIGATISEIIAGTTLLVYRKSLEQLNHYYNSLHNNERFLSVVNIVSKISDEKQDDIYIEIIKNQLELILQREIPVEKEKG